MLQKVELILQSVGTMVKIFLFHILVFGLLFLNPHKLLQSQEVRYRFDHLSLETGLSQSTVNCILQDSRGFLWIGTQDGLNRYDGYGFTIFRNRPADSNSLSHNWIQTMIEGEPGILWIGTWGEGLNKFDTVTNQVTRYCHEPGQKGLSHNIILAVFMDSFNTLWIGTNGGGLNRLDQGTHQFSHYRYKPEDPSSLSCDRVTSIYEDAKGTLWIGTWKGFNKLDRKTGRFTRYFHHPQQPNSLSGNEITAITGDKQGTLWIGTFNSGLNRYIPQEDHFKPYTYTPDQPNGVCSNTIGAILEDKEGFLWIGTGHMEAHGNGVTQLKINEQTGEPEFITFPYIQRSSSVTPSESSLFLSDRSVISIFEDRSGTLWLGTVQGGLNKLRKNSRKFLHYSHQFDNPNSLSDNSVLSIYEEKPGILWIGTYSGGLNRFDRKNNQFTIFKHDPEDPFSIGSGSIMKIYVDHLGIFWVGTGEGGLNRFDRDTKKFSRFIHDPINPDSISSNTVTTLLEDSSGHLWVGTWKNGLNRLDRERETFSHYPLDPLDTKTPTNDNVTHIYEDSNKGLWLCTYGKGLVKVIKSPTSQGGEPNISFVFYQHNKEDKTSISSNFLFTMLEIKTGEIWIGSESGLNRFNRQTGAFTCFSIEDGLANNRVIGLLEEGTDLWISTNNGISKLNTQTLTFKNFDTGDGLQSTEFNQGAYFKSQTGEMFFGGVYGFNAFFPDRITYNTHIPPIVITKFMKFDKPVSFPKAIHEVDHIQLSYKDRFFTFEFAALDFENPAKNNYAYKLEGFNDDWIECGTRRYASFTNLNGGEFTFKVKGSNNDGFWNEEGTAVRISISPPPWQSWWFRVAAVLLLLMFFLFLLQIRFRNMKQKLEKKQLQYELEFKTDFTAMLVHDLRNPLQCIMGYADLLEDRPDPSRIPYVTEIIKSSSSSMLSLIDDMLDISKFESGKMVITREKTSLIDILKRNITLMTPLLDQKHNRFKLNLEPLPPISIDPVRIGQVINNLISNALNFSPEHGVITISAKSICEDNQRFQEVAIEDQGPGIEPYKKKLLFEKYAQLNHDAEEVGKGTGLGLAVSRLIIEAHNGTIGCEDGAQTGTIFFFRIPEDEL
jgi:signal transduction histidine kinase/ligand-binding sensor domain-containing protein